MAGEPLDREQWDALLAGEIDAFCVGEGGTGDEPSSGVIFPGAFNPRHNGHIQMADNAARLTGAPVEFEISVENVDKPALPFDVVVQRLRHFGQGENVWISRSATFVSKSRIFPEATFIVGVDTVKRIGEPRYYQQSESRRDAAIRLLAEQGCRFLVYGRLLKGSFITLDELHLPAGLVDLCEQVPAAAFRVDISSTRLRSQRER